MSTKKITQDQFINKCKDIYGKRYNYDNTLYVNASTKISVTCAECNLVWNVTPGNHIGPRRSGCPNCKIKNNKERTKSKYNTEWFIRTSTNRHNDKFNYSITEYIDTNHKVRILCKTHGEFEQWPSDHMRGIGCPYCSGRKINKEKFIIELSNKHTKFKFDKFDYKGAKIKSIVICPIHGEFLQSPSALKIVKSNHGCEKCSIGTMLQTKIENGLIRDPKDIEEYELYRKEVWNITNKEFHRHYHKINPDNIKRGLQNHLDHKYSIQQGWQNKISANIIGSWVNLRLLPHKENRSKTNRCLYTKEELLNYYNLSLTEESFNIDNRIVNTIALPKVPHKKRTKEQCDAQSLRQTGRKTKKHSDEANAAKSLRLKGIKYPERMKPVMCEGIEFPSTKHAAKYYSIDTTTVYNRIKSEKFPMWYKM